MTDTSRRNIAVTMRFTKEEYEPLSNRIGNREASPVCRELLLNSLTHQSSPVDRLLLEELVALREENRLLLTAVLGGLSELCERPPATVEDIKAAQAKADKVKEARADKLLLKGTKHD